MLTSELATVGCRGPSRWSRMERARRADPHLGIVGAIHPTHAPLAELVEDAKAADRGPHQYARSGRATLRQIDRGGGLAACPIGNDLVGGGVVPIAGGIVTRHVDSIQAQWAVCRLRRAECPPYGGSMCPSQVRRRSQLLR